jgi:hypothetical protein
MNKKIVIVSLLVAGVLVANQAEAANIFGKLFKRGQGATTTTQGINKGKTLDNACIVKAIDKREGAIGVAYTEMSGKISNALSVRASALSASWAETDRATRLASRNAAWKTFKDTVKNVKDAHRVSNQGVWASFKTDAAACRVDVGGVEPENTEADL